MIATAAADAAAQGHSSAAAIGFGLFVALLVMRWFKQGYRGNQRRR
jgi:hypothetical protein